MTDALLPLFAALLIAVGLAGLGVAVLGSRRRQAAERPSVPRVERPVFLFDGDVLIDASTPASALIADRRREHGELEALLQALDGRFPDLRARLSALSWNGIDRLVCAHDSDLVVELRNERGLTRISLEDAASAAGGDGFAELERVAQAQELALLRTVANETPQLVWQEDAGGNLTWANAAYLSYADRRRPTRGSAVWPGSRLFDGLEAPPQTATRPVRSRHAVRLPQEDAEHWFDVTARPLAGSTVYFASCANDTVRAEHAQREFLQTLAKTFAQLSTGLAIFDTQRRLTMFNPALLDMFDLPFAFMSSRPTLEAILDRLREMRKLPEQRDYIGWRDGFAILESGANGGHYSERWNLPDGLTFRVTGRPHPDGAMAFVFEDISAEVSLTQRFRAEIETGQAVLDEIEDAIAVFSNANTLVMTNRAYGQLWQDGGPADYEVLDLRAAVRVWKARSAPTTAWRRIEMLPRSSARADPLVERVVLSNGRQIVCTATRIRGGMTMVRFAAAIRDLREAPLPAVTQPGTQATAAG